MTKRFVNVYNSGAITQGAANTPLTPAVALVLGPVVGLRLTLSASGAGTLSSVPILYGLYSLEIDDANQNVLMYLQNVNGTRHDIPVMSYVMSPRGTWIGDGPNISTSTQTQAWILYAPFALSRQPLYLKPTIAPYSVWGSQATGGTVSVSVDFIVDDAYSGSVKTMGLKSLQINLGTGDNPIGDRLDKSAPTLDMVVYTPSGDAALNYITFRRGKEVELEQATPAWFASEDEMLTISGHQSGLFNLRNTPFTANPETYLDVNAAAATTWVVYQIEQFD